MDRHIIFCNETIFSCASLTCILIVFEMICTIFLALVHCSVWILYCLFDKRVHSLITREVGYSAKAFLDFVTESYVLIVSFVTSFLVVKIWLIKARKINADPLLALIYVHHIALCNGSYLLSKLEHHGP